jgi:hypothetical protein
MQPGNRLVSRFHTGVLVLVSLAPLTLGCVKLKTLDCTSTPEGCNDLKPDTGIADVPVVSPDGSLPADAGQPDRPGRPDSAILPDVFSQEDTSMARLDGGTVDVASDGPVVPRDALTPDVAANEGGRVPDALSPDTADAMVPDTARIPDALLPDTGPAPDAGPIYTVTFSNGMAKGAMSGYGWVTMGAKDGVTSPLCGTTPITPSAPCPSTSTKWESTSALCISALIPALSASPTPTEYAENWGVQVGANASPATPPAGLGRTYSTITLNFTGTPSSGLRAIVHRSGDTDDKSYCAIVTSDTPIPLTSFNTTCWDGTGTSLTAADVSKIDRVGLEVVAARQEIPVTSLCLTSIVFGS